MNTEKTTLLTLILFCIMLSTPEATRAVAAESAKEQRPNIYDESVDGSKQISDAVAAAKKEHKHVLLQFGANWCIWCHRLHKLCDSDKGIAEELKRNYIVALVDVNKGHNNAIVTKYKGEKL